MVVMSFFYFVTLFAVVLMLVMTAPEFVLSEYQIEQITGGDGKRNF